MKTSPKHILQNGEDMSMSSRLDSRANLFPSLGCEKERKITAISGQKLFGLYGKYGPLGSLVKMLLESSRWFSPARRLRWEAAPLFSKRIAYAERNSNTSLKPYAKTSSMKDIPSSRLLFRLVPSARHINETEYGLLPTVQTQGLKRCNKAGKTEFFPLELLPTPTLIDAGSGRINKSPSPGAKGRPTIALAAKMGLLPAPTAQDGKNCQPTDGQTSQLNPLFVQEMMGYPSDWLVSPFQNGGQNR